MDEQRYIFAVYVVAPDEESARGLMRMATNVGENFDGGESFVDEWKLIKEAGFSGELFCTVELA